MECDEDIWSLNIFRDPDTKITEDVISFKYQFDLTKLTPPFLLSINEF